jgi:uncharacterized RDD family membrane protein YckC
MVGPRPRCIPMIWYYVKDGEAAGPISNEELLSQLRLGQILPTTLVWRRGQAFWQPAASVTPQIVPAPPRPSFSPALSANIDVPPELASGTPPVFPHFFCTLCGNIIPADQLVRIGTRAVCARCKPLYVQQVREGLDAPLKAPVIGHALQGLSADVDNGLADPWSRLVAFILDGVFIMVPASIGWLLFFLLLGIVAYQSGKGSSTADMTAGLLFLFFILLTFGWAFFYWTFFIGKRGATPGMNVMKLKMVCADGTPVSYALALGRAVLLYVINAFTMCLTNITAFSDRDRRTMVDMICNTRVVRN